MNLTPEQWAQIVGEYGNGSRASFNIQANKKSLTEATKKRNSDVVKKTHEFFLEYLD